MFPHRLRRRILDHWARTAEVTAGAGATCSLSGAGAVSVAARPDTAYSIPGAGAAYETAGTGATYSFKGAGAVLVAARSVTYSTKGAGAAYETAGAP